MRRAVQVVLVVVVSVPLVAPASARQLIRYEGATSARAWNLVEGLVIKKDSGRRFLTQFEVRLKPTCEDATTQRWVIITDAGRLGDNGEFSSEYTDEQFYFRIDGAISWGKGSGTVEFNSP